MKNKNSFLQRLAITQGRHLKIINNKIQLFPEKNWQNEMKLFKLTKLKYIEWVVSSENFKKNPLCQVNGFKIINKNLAKYKIKCRSVDLDFIVKENPLNFSKKNLNFFIQKIEIISKNAIKIGIKYLIFPFLESSSPKNKIKFNKFVSLIEIIRKKIPEDLMILIETDLKPSKVIMFLKKMKNKIFINYDLGNSASKNYNFNEEKKYFKYVKNIHLKDRIKQGSTVRFGFGNANFKKMFTFLSKNLDKYDFTLQPARSMYNKDIKEIKLNIEYIKKLLSNL